MRVRGATASGTGATGWAGTTRAVAVDTGRSLVAGATTSADGSVSDGLGVLVGKGLCPGAGAVFGGASASTNDCPVCGE